MQHEQRSDRLERRIPSPANDTEAALIRTYGHQVLDFIDEHRYSPKTVKSYQDRWERFQRYCAATGCQSLPTDEQTIVRFLVDVGQVLLGEEGDIVGVGASADHLTGYKAAIGWKHRREGHDDPTGTDAVGQILAAAARFDDDPEPALPLSRDVLVRLLSRPPGENLPESLVVAWIMSPVPVEYGALLSITAENIAIAATSAAVTIDGGTHQIESHPDPLVCPVAAWGRLRAALEESGTTISETIAQEAGPGATPSLLNKARLSGRRHSLNHCFGGTAATTTVDPRASGSERIRLTIGALAGGAKWCRDRALILTGYHGALRPGEIVALRSSDLTPVAHHGTAVLIRFAKNDPEGRGEHVGIRPDRDSAVCAHAALETWCGYMGAEPGDLPGVLLFPSSRAEGHIQPRGVTGAILRLCRRSGTQPTYSGYSLRHGKLQDSAGVFTNPRDVANLARHRDVNSQLAYVRGCLGTVADELLALLDTTAESRT